MYIWNTKALVKKLKNDELTQYERFKYFLLFLAFTAIAMEIPLYTEQPISTADIIESVSLVTITVLGAIACFRINSRGDNEDFIGRFVCISIPIGIRCAIAFTVLYTLYIIGGYVIIGKSFEKTMESTTAFDVAIVLAVEVVIYWRIGHYIAEISKSKEEVTSA